jgi:4-hydroxythreonine-4-phosphate dehydrogenase
MTALPRLAVTLGDPRGIGPEIVAALRADERVRASAQLVLVGPSGTAVPVDEAVGAWAPRQSAANAGRLAGLAIERAVALAQSGAVQGIVTAPIDKAALLAGV